MIFRKRKVSEAGYEELIAVAVAAVEAHVKSKTRKAPQIVAPSTKVESREIISSSWITMWRYEVSQHLYRRGGVRA